MPACFLIFHLPVDIFHKVKDSEAMVCDDEDEDEDEDDNFPNNFFFFFFFIVSRLQI